MTTDGAIELPTAYDPAALDETERRFWREIWESVPSDVTSEHGIELKSFGPYGYGYAWMKFVRDASPPDMPEPDGVEVRELSQGEGEPLGRIGAAGFDMPPWAATLFSDLPGRPGWRCYVTVIDDEPQACAVMLINDHVAEFGIAATLESARGRGCQSALLHRRIVDAAQAGCHTLFVETGERTAERPSASDRNILRAGFTEAYLRPNWQRRLR